MAHARIRRPLLALIVLVLALVVGYAVRALRDDHGGGKPSPVPSVSMTVSPSR